MVASFPDCPNARLRKAISDPFDGHALAAADAWVRRGSIIKTHDPFEGG
jgi:hypothetical protein